MGQKANPNSVRLNINKDWKSKWFSHKNYTIYNLEDQKLIKSIKNKLTRNAGIKSISIQRNPQEIKITIHTSKPGIIIGRNGQGIIDLTKYLENQLLKIRNQMSYAIKKQNLVLYKTGSFINKLKIDIVEVRDPELSALLMAQNIAQQLEKRVAFRRAIKQTMSKIMQKKAKGVKVSVAGRLGGVEIARNEKFSEGSIPLGTFKANVDYASEPAFTAYGKIGVKVWIYQNTNNPQQNI